MFRPPKTTFRLWFVLILLVAVLPACAPTPTPASPSPILPTTTARSPTRTPLPTASPTPLPVIEPVTIPTCAEGETRDTRTFNELIESLAQSLWEMDSYRYRTLYRYTMGDRYADDELSVEVAGTYRGLLASPVEGFFYLESQNYQRSHVILTDLRTSSRTETIVTEKGFWVRQGGKWMAFDSATPADLLNLADMFSPQEVLSFMIGGGGLAPGIWAEAPSMAQVETFAGREVMHRCWLPHSLFDEINAYLIHYESLYTFLSKAEIHLWTAEDDTQLVRLALTGKHIGERLGEYEGVTHDTPPDFLLWLDISDQDRPIDITPPALDQIALTIPSDSEPVETMVVPYNELPLPADAELVGVFGESEQLTTTPREYWWPANTIRYEGVLDSYLGPGWNQAPADQLPAYETKTNLSEAAAFYLNEMSRRGWQLKGKFYQLGWPVLYLFFERDEVILPVILETNVAGVTRISAILPPADDILEAILSGWTSYTAQNSDLSDDRINAIAFGPQGRAWIGTNSGLSVFDGEAWTTYTAENLDLATEGPDFSVSALAVDQQGRVWVGTNEGLSVFDGQMWKTYKSENSKLPSNHITAMTVDSTGRIWLGLGGYDELDSVGVFDGKTFTNYGPGDVGMPGGHMINVIASDLQDRIWIGTSGGGVYVFDGKTWRTVLKAKSPPHSTYVNYDIEGLAIDQQGQIWIGTGEGLSVFNGENWISYTPENSGLPFQWIHVVTVDAYDRVWVGGSYGAVSELETDGTWNTYTPIQNTEAGYSTNTMVVDPQGSIWVGTDEGLNVFIAPKPNSTIARVLLSPTPRPPTPTPMPTPGPGWTIYTTENSGLVSNDVNDVTVDGQGRVWVGTRRGVSVLSPTGEWASYTLANSGLVDDFILALSIDAKDRVWMGTLYGLAVLAADGTWKTYTPDDSDLAYQLVNELLVDGQGRVWIANDCSGSCGALSVLTPDGEWITYTTENSGLADYFINALAMDKQGRVWIGSTKGVSILAPNGQWTNYTTNDLGMAGDLVSVIALGIDKHGRAWIGSSGSGLIVLAPDGSHTTYTTSNSGLLSDDISALVIDEDGRVWLGTGAGLSVLMPDGRWESYTPTNSALINNISSLAIDGYGRVWIGTHSGLSIFAPNVP